MAIGLLTCTGASGATPSPIALHCTAVETWACRDRGTCKPSDGDDGESYSFDLVGMSYRAPRDRGLITDLEVDDGGFMTFVLGGERRYVHKNADGGDPMTSFLYVSPQDMRELRCTPRYAATSSDREAADRRGLDGHYYLSGVMETGAELLLRPDGRFAWSMSYGVVDQEAKGTWRVDGGAVLLDAGPSAGANPAFQHLRLQIDGRALVPQGAGAGRYERQP